MSNVEHLFENALLALENDYYFGEWKGIETDRHNTDGVSEEVIEAIWILAIYTKYTYVPSLKTVPVEWIRKYTNHRTVEFGDMWVFINCMINDWEKENDGRNC